ncbi:MAG: SIS domain-containing protein [Acidobacteriota bacterium]|nr:MAG: SIS domain-containing protein [Acidobacteriota bacterium]
MALTTHRERALEFLRVAHAFRLGELPTEQPDPRTRELSRWARTDLARAVSVLKDVDLRALATLAGYAARIDRLTRTARETIERGKRIFLCGCGATGRLSLTLEFLWRARPTDRDRVLSFMAGGDVALVHSLEGFEDHPRYGARHLEQVGFEDGDLLIGCTEGGETPYVIGAAEHAARISSNPPYFLYCNPDSVLKRRIGRFRRVHENPHIRKLCLFVGPMALTGSTRMQASTVLQLAVGAALLFPDRPALDLIEDFRSRVGAVDFSFLIPFIEKESEAYLADQRVIYRVRDFGITVFTDTTERSPTFSLVPFGRLNGNPTLRAPCHVWLEDARDPADALFRLLGRVPRSLNWRDVDPRTTDDYLRGFDFSPRARLGPGTHHEFHIRNSGDAVAFRFGGLAHDLPLDGAPPLFQHLLLKQLLNIHSTLVMGRLGRYTGNLMTWVAPTNGKLIDRATRYVRHLLADADRPVATYEEVVHRLFAEMPNTPPNESVVLATFRSLLNGEQGGCGKQAR